MQSYSLSPFRLLLLALSALSGILGAVWPGPADAGYLQVNLVSDIAGLAAHTDPNLRNPWGMASSATSPIWVSDNQTGVTTLYNTAGVPQALVVTIPPPAGGTPPSAPTGQVFNGTSSFPVGGGGPALFIFATEDGTISGWNPSLGTNAQLRVDNSAAGAVYKAKGWHWLTPGDRIFFTPPISVPPRSTSSTAALRRPRSLGISSIRLCPRGSRPSISRTWAGCCM